MDSNRIIDLTVKELSGSITPGEKEELTALISKHEENQSVYSETLKKWGQAGNYSLAAEGETEASWQSFAQKKDQAKAKVFVLSPFYKVAAAIIVVIGLGVVLFNPWGTVEYETGIGETMEVILADHTVVTLNESSRLVLRDHYNESERRVEFSGEAYFDVEEDPSRPFVIQSGVSEIRVLGTSFNVDANDKNESVEVDVTSGRVQLSEIGNTANLVVLTRGMKGTFESVNRQITTGEYQNQNFQSWRTRTLEFDDISMEEVLKDMEEYFGEEVSVSDQAILSCKFTSTFSEPEIGEVLEVVSLTLDLSVEETGEAYILSGVGCTENQK